jgi:hypothetical protein
MKGRLVEALMVAAPLATTLLAGCSSTQPAPVCLIGRDAWIGRYTKVSGPNSGPCVKTGEQFGMQKFGIVGQAQPTIAIRPDGINPNTFTTLSDGGIAPDQPVASDPTNKPYALGALAADAPNNNFCTVATLSDALTAVQSDCTSGCTAPDLPIRYTYSNLQIFVSPNHPFGTQAKASLTLSTAGGACVATYNVVALWPASPIGRNDNSCQTDEDCVNAANLGINQRFSSGIDDSYDVFCDTSLPHSDFTGGGTRASGRPARGFCMLRCNDIPCLKPGIEP